jgi:hypothetical protein
VHRSSCEQLQSIDFHAVAWPYFSRAAETGAPQQSLAAARGQDVGLRAEQFQRGYAQMVVMKMRDQHRVDMRWW